MQKTVSGEIITPVYDLPHPLLVAFNPSFVGQTMRENGVAQDTIWALIGALVRIRFFNGSRNPTQWEKVGPESHAVGERDPNNTQ